MQARVCAEGVIETIFLLQILMAFQQQSTNMTKGVHHMNVSNDKAQKSPVRKSKEKGIDKKTLW